MIRSNSTQTDDRQSAQSFAAAVQKRCGTVEDCVRSNPSSSMMVSLGIGLGIGVVAGLLLGNSRASQSHGWLDRRNAERVGSRVMEAISQVFPDSIKDRLPG